MSKDDSTVVTKSQAYTALDDMDDYARMGIGIDAKNHIKLLEKFIAESNAPEGDYAADEAANMEHFKKRHFEVKKDE
jgi:hypothetical protein